MILLKLISLKSYRKFRVDPKILSFSTGTGVMERYPTRHILDDLRRKMVFVGGPRQVGKTILALSVLQGNENHPAYLNCGLGDVHKIITSVIQERI